MTNCFKLIIRVIGITILLCNITISCSVKDGVDGVNGINGIDGNHGVDGVDGIDGTQGLDGKDGIDGAKGEDGIDGTDGIGFDEFDNYGAIAINLIGTRPDNVDFNHEAELKFISPEFIENNVNYDTTNINFKIARLMYSPDAHESNGIFINLAVENAGLSTQNFEFDLTFSDYTIFSDDLKYVEIDSRYRQDDIGVSNATITEYSFDDTTNNLKFSFTMNITGEQNETDNNLSISGTVDVLVFEKVVGSTD